MSAITPHTTLIRLPVAPRCNLQCRFCDRNMDCGYTAPNPVATKLLTPDAAVAYAQEVLRLRPDLTPENAAALIAGPGDALAEAIPDAAPVAGGDAGNATLRTLALLQQQLPELPRLVATNGLALPDFAERLALAGVSRVRLATPALDPDALKALIAFIRPGKRSLRGADAAALLLSQWERGVRAVQALGMGVTAVTLVIPAGTDIPDYPATLAEDPRRSMRAAAETLKGWGVDALELVPFEPRALSPVHTAKAATPADMETAKAAVAELFPDVVVGHAPQDAEALLGPEEAAQTLRRVELATQDAPIHKDDGRVMPDAERPYVAVATTDGETVDVHLGHAKELLVFEHDHGYVAMKEARMAPPKGGGEDRWKTLAETLKDVRILIVASAGENPRRVLAEHGVEVRVLDDAPLQGAVLHAFGVKPKGKGKGK